MKKFFLIAAVVLSSFATAQTETTVAGSNIEIYEGATVKARLKETIKGGSVKVGQKIEFELAEPIIVGDRVAVKQGARISGSVTECRSSGILGRKGKLEFNIDYLYLENGQIIKLTSNQKSNLKGSGLAVGAAAVLVAPAAIFIVGKGAKFEAGTLYDCTVAENITLK